MKLHNQILLGIYKIYYEFSAMIEVIVSLLFFGINETNNRYDQKLRAGREKLRNAQIANKKHNKCVVMLDEINEHLKSKEVTISKTLKILAISYILELDDLDEKLKQLTKIKMRCDND